MKSLHKNVKTFSTNTWSSLTMTKLSNTCSVLLVSFCCFAIKPKIPFSCGNNWSVIQILLKPNEPMLNHSEAYMDPPGSGTNSMEVTRPLTPIKNAISSIFRFHRKSLILNLTNFWSAKKPLSNGFGRKILSILIFCSVLIVLPIMDQWSIGIPSINASALPAQESLNPT